MSKILITGATGTIGSRLVGALMGQHQLAVLGRNKPESEMIDWVECNLGDTILPQNMPQDIDAVIYLAQSNNFREFPSKANDIFEVNIGSVHRLLNWAHLNGVKKFIYASSGGVYGTGDVPFKEDDPIQLSDNLGFYLTSKRCAELLAETYSGLMTVVTLRFFFVYGPEQKRTMLIPRLIESVKHGTPIQLDGQNGIKINPIYVDDAVRAIVTALSLNKSEKVNVAGPEALSMRDIGEIIGRAVGRSPLFVNKPEAVPKNLIGDLEKMTKLLAPPTIKLNEGITLMPGVHD